MRRSAPTTSPETVDRAMNSRGLQGIARSQKTLARHAATVRDADPVPSPWKILISRSDAGRQYTAIRFTEHLQFEGNRPSIGPASDALDSSLMECVIGLDKTECIRIGKEP